MRRVTESVLIGLLLASGSVPAADTHTRAVPTPPRALLYASAKNMERDGLFADAMAVYRMAIHNGVTGRAKDEAYLGLARCEEKQGNFWKAFLAVESSFPTRDELLALSNEERGKELQRRLKIETRLGDALAQKGRETIPEAKTKDGKNLNGWGAAAEVFNAIVFNNPKTPFARSALIKRGDCLRQNKDYDAAEKSYRLLINTFPEAAEVAEAKIALARLLAEKTQNNGGIRGDVEQETTAIFNAAATIPDMKPELKEKLTDARNAVNENKAQALLQSVKNYYLKRGGRKEKESARFLLADIVARYPQTKAATEAQELLKKIKR